MSSISKLCQSDTVVVAAGNAKTDSCTIAHVNALAASDLSTKWPAGVNDGGHLCQPLLDPDLT